MYVMLEKGDKLSKKERIRKRGDIFKLIQDGKRYYSNQHSLIVLNNGLNYWRFAISIKKRVGNAVARNYEKRLCRKVFRMEKKNLNKGFDVLIIIKEKTDNYYSSYNSLKNLLINSC